MIPLISHLGIDLFCIILVPHLSACNKCRVSLASRFGHRLEDPEFETVEVHLVPQLLEILKARVGVEFCEGKLTTVHDDVEPHEPVNPPADASNEIVDREHNKKHITECDKVQQSSNSQVGPKARVNGSASRNPHVQ
jgi:hypothetical protein